MKCFVLSRGISLFFILATDFVSPKLLVPGSRLTIDSVPSVLPLQSRVFMTILRKSWFLFGIFVQKGFEYYDAKHPHPARRTKSL